MYFNRMFAIVRGIVHGGKSEKEGFIVTVTNSESVREGTISIPPHNRVVGKVEVVPPPRIVTEEVPIKDAFVRSNIPTLNYGREEELVVGGGEEIIETYLEFRIDRLPPGAILDKAELILHRRLGNNETPLMLYITETSWDEYSINYVNRPPFKDLVTFSSNGGSVVKFDITSFLDGLVTGESVQVAFVVRGSDTQSFYSKESKYPPILRVTYYDVNVMSYGRGRKPGEVVILVGGTSDTYGEIELAGDTDHSFKGGFIEIFNPAMRAGEIIINRPDTYGEITIGHSDREGTLSVISKSQEQLNGEIYISRDTQYGEIGISFRDDKVGELNVLFPSLDIQKGTVHISIDKVFGDITIPHYNHNEGYIQVINDTLDVKQGDIHISVDRVPGSVIVPPYVQKEGTIEVVAPEAVSKQGLLIISTPETYGEVIISPRQDKEGILGILNSEADSKQGELLISTPETYGEIIISHRQDKEGTLGVLNSGTDSKQGSMLVTRDIAQGIIDIKATVLNTGLIQILAPDSIIAGGEVKVAHRNDIPGELTVMGQSLAYGEVDIQSEYTEGFIYIPAEGAASREGEISVLVKGISEVACDVDIYNQRMRPGELDIVSYGDTSKAGIITVKKSGGYGFII